MRKYNCIIILGPTGSGKTELSLNLAKKTNGEIINADSMQVYKYFNIGTAKATEIEMQQVKHHLIDFLEPTQRFTVADYKKLAHEKIEQLMDEHKTPIIVGGTGFYIDSILNNYSYGFSEPNLETREKYNKLLQEKGKEFLFSILQEVDSETANKLHVNDTKRVIRALEIYESAKTPKSNIIKNDIKNDSTSLISPLIVGLNMNREELYERINIRVDIMIKQGLLDEAKIIFEKYHDRNLQPMQGIGYKELFDYFEGKLTLDDSIEKIKKNSRNYAKRQLTWFRRNKEIIWFNKSDISNDEILESVLKLYLN